MVKRAEGSRSAGGLVRDWAAEPCETPPYEDIQVSVISVWVSPTHHQINFPRGEDVGVLAEFMVKNGGEFRVYARNGSDEGVKSGPRGQY